MPWNLTISDIVALGVGVNVYNFSHVAIGRQVLISQNVFLCTGTHDYQHRDMPLCYKGIIIEPFAWVAANVFIGPGVTVHEGGVVGACSVVTRDTPAWTVVAGNPARAIKQRIIAKSE
jgi:putative colanic acid biosynthesis acetyltransferase WcaF